MPPMRTPAPPPAERTVAPNGAGRFTNGDVPVQGPAPTPQDVVDLCRRAKAAIREEAASATALGEQILAGSTPPDGAQFVLPSETKAIRKLRALRDRKTKE